MPVRRVTLKDVARAAGVHYTTVSLVLRGNARFSPATAGKVKRIARELGYTPDPVARALTQCRPRGGVAVAPRIAYLSTAASEESFFDRLYNRLFLEGAQEAARNHGYTCDLVLIREHAADDAGLGEFLRSRNYVGLIFGAFDPEVPIPSLPWGEFGLVRIDSTAMSLPIRSVCNDQMQVVQLAYRRLRELGYRRIGLAVGEADEDALGNLYTAGLYAEMMAVSPEERIPPLLFGYHARSPDAVAMLRSWVLRHGIDAVMSNWSTTRTIIEEAGFRVPEAVACAGLCLAEPDPTLAGVLQNHRRVGARAVEELAVALRSELHGLSDAAFATYVAGTWCDGDSAPRREQA